MNQFTKRGFVVTAVHVGVVSLLLISTELSRLFHRNRPVAPIEFTIAIPDLGQSNQKDEPNIERTEPKPTPPVLEQVKIPEPKPEPKVEKHPDKTITVVEDKPKDAWKPADPKSITIGPKVKGPKLPPPTVDKSDLSLSELDKLLKDGATPGLKTVVPEGDDLFRAKIQNACKRAWDQPSAIAADGKTVSAEIRFSLTGEVLGWQILRRSGVAELDESVEDALASVGRVPGIPREFFEYYKGRFPITFKVED